MIKKLLIQWNNFLTRYFTETQLKWTVIGLLVLTAAAAGGYWGITTWFQPLDSALELPTSTPDVVQETSLVETAAAGGNTPVPIADPVCGGPPSMTVLVAGVASERYTYGLADAIRVVRVDFVNQQVTVLALPRDLWVQIPGIADHGISEGKLNQAYFYGTQGMGYYDGSGGGSGLLAQTLQANYGLRVDHYLAVNLNSFEQIIDAMGGIDVYLAQDVYRKQFGEPELFLKAGSHHLNGREAELLARSRIEIGDFGRINNQTVILKAAAAKMLSPQGIASLPNLVDRLRDNVLTDLSPSDGRQLICLGGKIDQGQDVTYLSLPQDLLEEGLVYDKARGQNTYALQGDPAEIGQLLQQFQAGTWPE